MNRTLQIRKRTLLLILAVLALAMSSRLIRADTGTCGGLMLTLPFVDVPGNNIFFCAIAQAFFTGLTNGTSATTYSPSDAVTREQMAAFITRTQDSALKRGSRRATAGQWATPQDVGVLKATSVIRDITVSTAKTSGWQIYWQQRHPRSRPATGGCWGPGQVRPLPNTIAAAGFIYVTGLANPGTIYRIDPGLAPGVATLVENNIGRNPRSITYDGLNLWTANDGGGAGLGSITRYNILTDIETAFGVGFNQPAGIV